MYVFVDLFKYSIDKISYMLSYVFYILYFYIYLYIYIYWCLILFGYYYYLNLFNYILINYLDLFKNFNIIIKIKSIWL